MKQVSLAFTLGKYEDEVLCDRKMIYDGVTNRFMFVHKGQKFTLKPLSLKEVNKDQVKMKTLSIQGKNDEENEKSKEMLITSKRVDILRGLPPIIGIEHQIDFTMGATLPTRAVCIANLEESKEI
ncbi:hypothetical protein CR513_44189, partial [Mucuna pruriens]